MTFNHYDGMWDGGSFKSLATKWRNTRFKSKVTNRRATTLHMLFKARKVANSSKLRIKTALSRAYALMKRLRFKIVIGGKACQGVLPACYLIQIEEHVSFVSF
jgi:hypothetical protein